jgi:predicted dehydrogenase
MLARDALDPPNVYGLSHREQIAEMISAVKEHRDPTTNGNEARKSLQLVCAIYDSARTHREVFINQ